MDRWPGGAFPPFPPPYPGFPPSTGPLRLCQTAGRDPLDSRTSVGLPLPCLTTPDQGTRVVASVVTTRMGISQCVRGEAEPSTADRSKEDSTATKSQHTWLGDQTHLFVACCNALPSHSLEPRSSPGSRQCNLSGRDVTLARVTRKSDHARTRTLCATHAPKASQGPPRHDSLVMHARALE